MSTDRRKTVLEIIREFGIELAYKMGIKPEEVQLAMTLQANNRPIAEPEQSWIEAL